MNEDYAQKLLSIIRIKCPLCEERFKYRVNLRNHLKRNHTDIEADYIFLNLEKNIVEL